MKNVRFQLEELTCPSCIKKIEGVLKREKGVEDVTVLFNLSRVNVTYDESQTNPDKLGDLIERLGYAVLSPKKQTA